MTMGVRATAWRHMTATLDRETTELTGLRLALVRETSRLHALDGDPALVWAADTLGRLLQPRALRGRLDDWVLQAALDIVTDAARRVGSDLALFLRARALLS